MLPLRLPGHTPRSRYARARPFRVRKGRTRTLKSMTMAKAQVGAFRETPLRVVRPLREAM